MKFQCENYNKLLYAESNIIRSNTAAMKLMNLGPDKLKNKLRNKYHHKNNVHIPRTLFIHLILRLIADSARVNNKC